MAHPQGFEPYVTSHRRYLFLRARDRAVGDEASALVFQSRRLAVSATALPSTFPSRAQLLAADVLAVEEVQGAGTDELRSYGLTLRAAEAVLFFLEGFTMSTFALGPRIGQFYEEDDVTLLASATRTTSGTSEVYEVGDKGTLRLDLDVTAVSGTAPRLHVQIETRKAYASGTWRVVDAFDVATAVSAQRRAMSGCDRHVRVVYTLEGTTPSFAFSVSGEAV